MIYCPKCKTANRDGSRFCNECGEPFSRHTEVRCPNCGASNSIQSAFCGDCGGHLLSLSTSGAEGVPTIKGLSLPTKAPLDDSQADETEAGETGAGDDVPGWLRELGSAGVSEEQAAAPPENGSAEDVPAWLQDLRASLPEEPEAGRASEEESGEEIPDWLSGLRPSTQAPPPETPVPEAEEVPEAPAEALEAEEVPEWLAGLRSAEEVPASASEVSEPDLSEGVLPEAEMTEAPEGEEVPEWLAGLRPAEEVSELAGAGSELADLDEEGPETPVETPEGEEVPDWLAGLRQAGEEPVSEPDATPADALEAEAPEAPTEAAAEELPPWLADLHAAEEAPVPEADASAADMPWEDVTEEEVSEIPAEVPEEASPEWLADLRAAEEAPVPEAGTAGMVPSESDASWEDVSEEEVSEIPTEVSGEALPEWLVELRAIEEPPAFEEAAPEAEGAEALSELSEADTPDWLAALRPAAGLAAAAELASEDGAPEVGAPEVGAPQVGVPEGDVLEPDVSEAEVSETESAEAVEEPSEADTPDWLAALRPAAGLAAAAALVSEGETAEAEAPEEGVSEAEASEAEAIEADGLEVLAETPAEAIPEWLAQMPAAEETGAPEAEGSEVEAFGDLVETPEEDFPEWLAELRPAEEASASAEGALEGEGPEDSEETVAIEGVPPWLVGIRPGEEAIVPEAEGLAIPPEALEGEEGEAPDWLAELPPAVEADETETIAAGAALAAAAIPGWLAELRPDSEDEPSVPDEAVADEADLPEWLVPTQEIEGESLARAEIPDWLLALKPSELREGEPLEAPQGIAEVVEETGLLAGLSGTLPAEMLIVQPRAAAPPIEPVAVVDDAHARLFAEIVGRAPAVAPTVVEQPRANLLALLPRWIIYLALLGVVALPILLGQPVLPRSGAPVPAMVSDLYESIAALSADAPVLVAFDYDPTTSGEMDVVAQAIVDQLMDQEARIAVVSLLPAGPPTAQSLMVRAAGERPDYADGDGQRYVNLGFLPGQASAVWRMGQSVEGALPQDLQGRPLSDLPALDGVSSLDDFDLVIELAANQDTLRWWVEQAVAPHDIALGAGVSAAIEPAARAYYETDPRQVVGLVAGVLGTASYESLGSDEGQPEDRTGARLDGQLGGHLVFVLVILAGAGTYFVRREPGRER